MYEHDDYPSNGHPSSRDVWERGRSTNAQAENEAQEGIDKLKSSAAIAMDNAKQKAGDLAHEAGEKAHNAKETIQQKGEQMAHDFSNGAKETLATVKKNSREISREVDAKAHRHPYSTGLAFLAVGVAAGVFLATRPAFRPKPAHPLVSFMPKSWR